MSMRKGLWASILLAALMVLVMAVQAPAETLKPKVDNFILFVDYSGSMNMSTTVVPTTKIENAKALIAKMNAEIPALNYQSGVYTFAPFEGLLAPTAYDKAKVAKANDAIKTNYDPFGRNTPMGMGLDSLDPVLAKLSGKTAVIIFTDGDSNYGVSPVAEAKAMFAKYQGRVCFHVVSYADNANGKMVVDEIRALNRCSVSGDPKALGDAAAMKKFVRDVFYDVEGDAAPRSLSPAAACETITFGNLNFAFNKYQIVKEMEPALEQALSVLKSSKCDKFIVEGHTDSVGGVPYNQKLSERRANSVAKWLKDKGFTGKLAVEGKGKLQPKYDNKTDEGRALNRRVEIRSN